MPPHRDRRTLPAAAVAVCAVATAAHLLVARSPSLAVRAAPLVVAAAGYAAVLVSAGRGRPPATRLVVAAGVALVVVAVAVPPQRSRDVYLYGMQGRVLAVHHANPYLHGPAEFAGDPLLPFVSPPFRDGGSNYGPAFTVVEAAGALVAGGSPLATRVVFQGLAGAAALAALAVVHRRGLGAGALAFLALSPVVVVKGVNEGHVDVLLGLLVVVAVVLADRRRVTAAAVVVGVAVLVKVLAAACLVALVVRVAATLGRRAAARAAAVAGGVVVAGYLAAGGAAALGPLSEASMHQSRASVWAGLRATLTGAWAAAGDGVAAGESASRLVARLSLVAVAVVGAALVLGSARRPSAAPAVGGAFVAYLLLGVYVPAWYVAAALPTLALVWRSPPAVVAAAHGCLLAVAYVYSPHLTGDPLAPTFRGLAGVALPALQVVAAAALAVTAARAGTRGGAGAGRPPPRAASPAGPTPPPAPAPAP